MLIEMDKFLLGFPFFVTYFFVLCMVATFSRPLLSYSSPQIGHLISFNHFFILRLNSPTTFIHLGICILTPFFHLNFIHFSSHDYINPSIHPRCPFIGNSSNIYPCFIKFSICSCVFTSMFFNHATFIIHSSSIHALIIHFSSKIENFPSCLPFMHLIMFMLIYLKLHKKLLFNEIKIS